MSNPSGLPVSISAFSRRIALSSRRSWPEVFLVFVRRYSNQSFLRTAEVVDDSVVRKVGAVDSDTVVLTTSASGSAAELVAAADGDD